MSLILPKTCSMGGSKTGLVGTIGVALLNPDGTVHTARATAGIYEIGGGCYGKEITFPDNWKGSIKWDTGGGTPVYATEDYDVEGLIDMIEEDTSKMNFTGTDIKATLDGEKVALSDATETQIDAIKTETDKIQPEIIDKKDEYKATGFAKPGDVKCGGGGGGAIIERPDIWKPEEKLKLIEDIKKIYKMISELGSLQSAGLQNVKKNIEDFKNSLIKLIKEEVILLVTLKKTISEQPQTDSSDALADSVNQLIAKWDSIQKSILKSSDLSSLDNKLDDLSKIMAKSLSNKALEELINAE